MGILVPGTRVACAYAVFSQYNDSPRSGMNTAWSIGMQGMHARARPASMRAQVGAPAAATKLRVGVNWRYNYQPEKGSVEAELTDFYLQPRDWLANN